jgi:flagellar hook-basal body complex protein FliE
MSGLEMIAGIGAVANLSATRQGLLTAAPAPIPVQDASFASILSAGMREVESKIATANDLVRKFALDDSVPLHRVTYALEEARLSVELAMQVRSRLIESYRELMNMQL